MPTTTTQHARNHTTETLTLMRTEAGRFNWRPGDSTTLRVFVRVTERDGKSRLSITGESAVSAGQNDGDLRTLIETGQPGPGLTKADLERLLDIWEKWHLNDMRAGCVHQRADPRLSATLTLYTHAITTETFQRRNKAERQAMEDLKAIGSAAVGDEVRALLNLPWDYTGPDATPREGYELKKTEHKHAGHVYPKEHPDGMLTRPCATCGYAYGSACLYEALPDDVLAFLATLPGGA